MTGAGIDPAVQLTARAGLAILFASAAWHKLRDPGTFLAAVTHYELLPARWTLRVAALLIAAEVGIAVGLWAPRVATVAAVGAAALLITYAGAMAAALGRGRRDLDCGCAGPAGRQPVRGALVARNLALAAAAVTVSLPAGARSLTWIDGLTIVAAVCGLALLYGASERLLALAPALGQWRAAHASPMRDGAEAAHG
jgi:hypothetical protein